MVSPPPPLDLGNVVGKGSGKRHTDCALNGGRSSRTAMTPTEVTEKLGLLRMKDRSWYCHPSNAVDGDGLFEGAHPSRSWTARLSLLTVCPPTAQA